MKVLVTGHRGYIGALLTRRLTAASHTVTGWDADFYQSCAFGPDPESPLPPAQDITRDIRDVTAEMLTGFDAVLHLAGLSNDPLGDLDPQLTQAINTDATLRLATAAKAAGIARFVYASSCSNYGASGTDDWLTEEAPLHPVTPYARSKVDSEAALDALADAHFSPVFLRPATAYGVSPRIRFDLVVNNLTAWAMATGQVRLKSDGSAWRPLVHIADIAQAFEKAMIAPRDLVHRQAFNVGRNADCMQIRDLAAQIHLHIPGTEITFAGGASADTRTYRVDCSKIARLGFAPVWSVAKGVEELRTALTASPVPAEDFEGARYGRVAHIRAALSTGRLTSALRPAA